MKKHLLTAFGAFVLLAQTGYSQTDTLLYADFETDPSAYMQTTSSPPPGNTSDTSWYNFDADFLADGSGQSRALEWFWSQGFSDLDSAGGVMASSSWTNGPDTTRNWMITKSITILDSLAVLSWKSAPFQTPKYLDGYKVVISTTSNDLSAFTDTIFVAGEFVQVNANAGTYPNLFSSYDFSPGFIHGQDSTYTLWGNNTTDSFRLQGVLRPFTKSLKKYANKTIFIAFLHEDNDDNLISIDDILVTGTKPVGISEVAADIKFKAFPNPATDKLFLDLTILSSSEVSLTMFDVMGRKALEENLGRLSSGQYSHSIDISNLATGMYTVKLTTAKGSMNFKVQVK